MWNLADRIVKAVSDATVGTAIVLVHVALVDRAKRSQPAVLHAPKRLSN